MTSPFLTTAYPVTETTRALILVVDNFTLPERFKDYVKGAPYVVVAAKKLRNIEAQAAVRDSILDEPIKSTALGQIERNSNLVKGGAKILLEGELKLVCANHPGATIVVQTPSAKEVTEMFLTLSVTAFGGHGRFRLTTTGIVSEA